MNQKITIKLFVFLTLTFNFLFYAVYGLSNYITSCHDYRIYIHFEFEKEIPFIPEFSAVYLSVGAMLGLSFFILKRLEDLIPFFIALVYLTLIAGVFFIFIPVESAYPVRQVSGYWGIIFRIADTMNLQYNLFPSLHVAFATVSFLNYWKFVNTLSKILLFLWTILIILSTLFIHEHHILDIVSGIVLAYIVKKKLYPKYTKQEFLNNLKLEIICLGEFKQFIQRHLRYFSLFLVIYAKSIFHWKETRIIRVGYCFAQALDDILDGDRYINSESYDYVQDIIKQIETNSFNEQDPLSLLGKYVVEKLDEYNSEKDNPYYDLMQLLEILLFDRKRVMEKILLNKKELLEHHRKTFYHSLNLTLILTKAEYRAEDVKDLVDELSWCSPMRDLEEDLKKGLVNIPKEVLEQSNLTEPEKYPHSEIVKSSNVQDWIRQEYEFGLKSIQNFELQLHTLKKKKGYKVAYLFHFAIKKYAKKYKLV